MNHEPDTLSLPERLQSWAQNEEMIDQYFLAHGRDCLEAVQVFQDMSTALEAFLNATEGTAIAKAGELARAALAKLKAGEAEVK